MPFNPTVGQGTFRVLVSVVLTGSLAWAADAMPRRMYAVTIETGMPHLEENLRYTTTREKRCLSHQDLSSAFPILQHASLADCRLAQESRQGDTVSYLLVCEGGHGTTGNATWQLGRQQIRGTLNVRLGGKNMTFHQRVTATPAGEC
ncbi:MAG TPA: DUF3617 family protein [Steroidobacteraceae bacterium]|nr:DUF3617 family protein [Steroidobacteraceae bacterium]